MTACLRMLNGGRSADRLSTWQSPRSFFWGGGSPRYVVLHDGGDGSTDAGRPDPTDARDSSPVDLDGPDGPTGIGGAIGSGGFGVGGGVGTGGAGGTGGMAGTGGGVGTGGVKG